MMTKISHFFFPSLCLHCQNVTEKTTHLFCSGCLPYFELLEPKHYPTEWSKQWQIPLSAALPYLGPVSSLVKKLKFGQMPFLAKTAAAFLTTQFHRLGWPLPDLLVPVPRPPLRSLYYGINHAKLITKHLGKSLNLPGYTFLRRKGGDYPQARLNPKQREATLQGSFYLLKPHEIEDKTLLVVDDVITTGTTLKCAVETLLTGFPRKIYVLTLCCSDKNC